MNGKQMSLLHPNERWRLVQEDCILHMPKMPAACIDHSVFSPPFPAMFAYGDSESDIGNSEDFKGDAKIHLSFFYHQLVRVMKPGRVVIVHCMQLPRLKRSGEVGLHDFRGLNIRLGERSGLIYEYDWCVRKAPQAQAIRTRSRELQFAGLESDRARSRGALADYLIKFRAPGENEIPVVGREQVSRNDWIDWAECCWGGIKETDTLNTLAAKGENDTRHICPLSLPIIRRCIRLFTNPDEIVYSPFAGIGSEGFIALIEGRRFYGNEIKNEYVAEGEKNLRKAEEVCRTQMPLFAEATT
jgi:hypothetical protein